MIHFKYLTYILRHKWYVFVECIRLGIPWLGLVHDLSKFRPCEWIPYARYFYGDWPEWAKMTPGGKMNYLGSTKESVAEDFHYAWLEHIHANKHHGQHWVLREDEGEVKCLRMPERYVLECYADWVGAGKAQGFGDNTASWYEEHKAIMHFHPDTQREVEHLIRQHSSTKEAI